MSRREKHGQCRRFAESMPSVSHEWTRNPALAISAKSKIIEIYRLSKATVNDPQFSLTLELAAA